MQEEFDPDPNSEYAQSDCFKPPAEPRLVQCMDCGQTYMSSLIWWDGEVWSCPTANCGGAGYHFEIFEVGFWEEGGEGEGYVHFDDEEEWDEEEEEGEEWKSGKPAQWTPESDDESSDMLDGDEYEGGIPFGDGASSDTSPPEPGPPRETRDKLDEDDIPF